MSKFVDELHNKEDAASFARGLGFFLAVVLGLGALGVIFWSAF